MFTNEFLYNRSRTVIMDDTGQYEDLVIEIDEYGVTIRQINETGENFLILTADMFNDMMIFTKHSEGIFKVEYEDPK